MLLPLTGKEQPDKKSRLFAGAMRKTICGLSHYGAPVELDSLQVKRV